MPDERPTTGRDRRIGAFYRRPWVFVAGSSLVVFAAGLLACMARNWHAPRPPVIVFLLVMAVGLGALGSWARWAILSELDRRSLGEATVARARATRLGATLRAAAATAIGASLGSAALFDHRTRGWAPRSPWPAQESSIGCASPLRPAWIPRCASRSSARRMAPWTRPGSRG